MAGATSRPPAAGSVTALTVHGPRGVVDLTVPVDATLAEVSRAYSAEAGLPVALPLLTRSGRTLQPTTEVADAGLVAGSVLVAVDPTSPAPAPASRQRPSPSAPSSAPSRASSDSALRPGSGSGVWLAVAVASATVAGWCAAQLGPDDRWPVVVVLVTAAAIGCLPFGALAAQRALAAPAFAAAACFAAVWDPAPERLPTVLGAAALAGAVTAAVARALADPESSAQEGLRVWMVVGAAWFLLAAVAALASAPPQVVWALLFLLAVMGARFVPELAVDVPDSFLIDLERLAVTAWSARERPRGRRGRIVVPPEAVTGVAARGARTISAASAAILVVVALAAPLLIRTADLPLDRVGARCLVGFGGAALVLAARSYRHVLARRLLRLAGVLSLAVLSLVLLRDLQDSGSGLLGLVAILAIGLALLLVMIAVLVGRGWRSAWWSRRAEVAEALCGAFAIGALVLAVGLFRHLWELTS